MTPVKLWEHRTHPRVALRDEEVGVLVGLGVATADSKKDGWTVRTRQHVGCVQAGGTEVWIRPKVPIGRLLYLAGRSREQTPSYRWRDDDVQLGEAEGLVPAMAILLVKLVSRAFRPGVLHGYQEREERLHLLRGRLRMSAQAQRHPGMPLPLEVRYEDLVADIPENQRLLAAIREVLSLPGVPSGVAQQLIRLRSRLSGVTVARHRSQLLGPPPATRLNAHYQPALRLADVILAGNSLDQLAGDIQATGFLLDMNIVFQNYLAGMLTARLEADHGGKVESQYEEPFHWSDGRELTLRPDIVWRRDGKCIAVLDAKYKGRIDETADGDEPPKRDGRLGVPPEDVYQVFTYCKALGSDQGHLIHADTRSPEWRSIEIDGVTITVHAMNLRLPWGDLQDQEERLVSRIVG